MRVCYYLPVQMSHNYNWDKLFSVVSMIFYMYAVL